MIDYFQAWLLLNHTKGLGSARISALLSHCETVENIFTQTSFPPHLNIPKAVQSDLKNPNLNAIAKDLTWLQQQNNHILTIDNDLYPPLLKQTDSPPPLLFVTGNPDVLLQPQLAVVGSRNASAAGLSNTQSFCYDLASKGLTITSGMALGIDGKAHLAAMEAGGKTVAVMGTGLDVVYPAQHKDMAHNIAQNGALISEFPIGTKPHAYNFPRRNRIICGLAMGTLVVEAGMKSGTLITARQTMEINRPVMAIPGSIHSPMVKGCHLLIKQGAKLVESAQEILEELTPLAQSLSLKIQEKLSLLEDKPVQIENKPYIESENINHDLILKTIMYSATSYDEIIFNSGLSATEVSSILLILELEDKIQALPGAKYIRI
ncbi:Rossmann fold nucleotide-binding protein Smf possibly involved in DNA uptake [hydrothermal vent metagenome]|uniref:Rossmann fold nucleotide-binding protein Smf possibly involved in DNA uptake n=1 Tax=hydrothermal vent metagenome TaxID=652676 RepID=A0A3B0V2G8_9ZZZZ